MNNFQNQLKFQWHSGSIIIKLIMLNVAIFVVTTIMIAFAKLFQFDFSTFFKEWFALSPNLKDALFKPWTMLTYGFFHRGFFHLLFNMLWLFWIGNILVEYIGARKTLPIYLFGIILGAVVFLLAINLFPLFSDSSYRLHNIGGSAGFMAILWATVTLLPKHTIRLFLIGTIPLLYLAIFVTAIDVLNVARLGGASFSHLGGAIAGFIYVKLYQQGTDLSKPFNNLLDKIATLTKPQKKTTNFNVKKGGKKNNYTAVKQNKTEQQQVDDILDKINQYGYESLSRREKEFLFKQSKKTK